MDYQAMGFWWMVALSIFNIAIGLYLWWEKNNNATAQRIARMEKSVDERLDDHATKLSRLDEHIKHVPSDEDLVAIHHRIDTLMGEFKELRGEFHAANHMLRVIHQHMLSFGAK